MSCRTKRVGRDACDTPIDEDARQRNLSALNVIIHHGDISSSRPREVESTYVERAAQITFVPQNFFCHARDDPSLAAKRPCVQKRIDCSRENCDSIGDFVARHRTVDAHRARHFRRFFKPRRRFVKLRRINLTVIRETHCSQCFHRFIVMSFAVRYPCWILEYRRGNI